MDTRKSRSPFVPVLLGVCLAVSAGVSRADGCKANLHSTLEREERERETITYTFEVDVSSPERCADVDYVLKVVESASGEKDRTKKIPRHTRVRDGYSVSAKVSYRLPAKRRLVSWKFETVSCQPCGAAKLD